MFSLDLLKMGQNQDHDRIQNRDWLFEGVGGAYDAGNDVVVIERKRAASLLIVAKSSSRTDSMIVSDVEIREKEKEPGCDFTSTWFDWKKWELFYKKDNFSIKNCAYLSIFSGLMKLVI